MVMVVLRVRVKVVVRIVGDDDGMINFKLFGFLLRSNFRVSISSIQIIRIIAPTLLKISSMTSIYSPVVLHLFCLMPFDSTSKI